MVRKISKSKEFDPISGWRLYYKNRPTTLYYVKFTYRGKDYYKIGITTKTVEQRFIREPIPYEILFTKLYSSGELAYIREQQVLQKYTKYRYIGSYILRTGNSELFNINIMKGDI